MTRHNPGYWTIENTREEALKFKTRTEFQKKSHRAYKAAYEHDWLDLICQHMPKRAPQPFSKWTFEKIHELALTCKYRSEFKQKNQSAYNSARNQGILEQVCSHMTARGNMYTKALYVYEFSDHSVYVGLTYDYDRRHAEHLRNSEFFKEKANLTYEYKRLNNWCGIDEIKIEEQKLINKYRDEGWTILNQAKAGSVGSGIKKWNKDTISAEAKKYNRRVDFMKGSGGAYNAAAKLDILEEVCHHMLSYNEILSKRNSETKCKAIICNETGIEYKSIKEAAEALNTTSSYISGMLNGKYRSVRYLTFRYK